jgi:hypothetical protein
VGRGILCILIAVGMAVAASPARAATWTHVGTSGFAMGDSLLYDPYETRAEHDLTDADRIKFSSMVVDRAGNIFAVCNDDENDVSSLGGGVTVFRADGSIANINLQAAGLFGGLTKLVLAGDGKVYGVQNFAKIQWPGGHLGYPHRILRFNVSGTCDIIWIAPDVLEGDPPVNKSLIRGIATGPGGYVYWIMNGASDYWRHNLLWRYNFAKEQVEASPINQPGHGAGLFETYGMNAFEYVGGDWFAMIDSDGHHVSAIGWTVDRTPAANNIGATWASDRTTAMVYDPVYRKLWHGPRGTSEPGSGPGAKYTAIMARWNGDPANLGLFTEVIDGAVAGIVDDPTSSDTNASVWHMNGNNPQVTGQGNGARYWCNALAVNPADGTAWMSWGGNKYHQASPSADFNYTGYGPYGPVGAVYTVTKGAYGPGASEGTPRVTSPRPSWVMALAFGQRSGSCRIWALTCDLNNGQYDLYEAPVACPPVGACCQRGNACTMETQTACVALGGEYHGDNVPCSQTTCNVVGACCRRQGECSMELPTDCVGVSESFQGVGVPCEAVDCRWQICQAPAADADGDGDVDSIDFGVWQSCLTVGGGEIVTDSIRCDCFDTDRDGTIDAGDLETLIGCGSGPGIAADPACGEPTR